MRGIFCLERNWYPSERMDDDRETVSDLFPFFKKIYGIKTAHYNVATAEELQARLENARFQKGKFGILYLAFEGNPGNIEMEDKSKVRLPYIAEWMQDHYQGWYVHFGSCNTFACKPEDLFWFKNQTGARMISGYEKWAKWNDKYAALEIGLLSMFIRDGRTMDKTYNQLIKYTGLVTI